jgi:predicted phosphoadenosine phosphosulfate sulfurtransferase
MNKIYVLNFNDSSNYCAYATKEAAKKVLWESYCDELLPNIPESNREAYLKEDTATFEESDYIIDYGWVEEVTFVNE